MHKDTPSRRSEPLTSDDRGVSEVLGAILIFGLIVAVIVLIQANAVPAANKQVEFEHNQRVTGDFQSLQGELYRVGASGSDAAVTVETGVTYPPRFFLLNPGPSTGAVRTTPDAPIEIANAIADGETGDYWNGTSKTYYTRGLGYTPNYNELPNAGTLVWEHSTLFNRQDSGALIFEDPTGFVDGNKIRLTLVEGQLSRSALSTSVELSPVSTRKRTVTIRDDPAAAGDNITLTITTTIPDSEWADILAGEPATVTSIDETDDTVTIRLNDDESYQLSVAVVRVGPGSTPNPPAAYLTSVPGPDSVPEDSSARLVVEARDRYNNPVANERINYSVVGGPTNGDVTAVDTNRTDSEGQVTLRYSAPTNVDGTTPVRVRADINGSADSARQVEFEFDVLDSDNSGSPPVVVGNASGDGVSSINPGKEAVRLIGASGKNSGINLTLLNEAGTNKTLSEMRLLFATQNDQSDTMQWLNLTGYDPATGSFVPLNSEPRMDLFGPYVNVTDVTIPATEEMTLTFITDKGSVQGDLVAISVIWADGSRNNYFANL